MLKPTATNNKNVEYIIPALGELLPLYDQIRDCLKGARAVKAGGARYLPMPNAHDQSLKNVERYNSYLTRAVFYGVTKRTLAGLVGQVTMIDPVIEVPDMLDSVIKDANGSGVSLTQLAEEALNYNIAYGRAGLLTDYPTLLPGQSVSRQDQQTGAIRPTINLYAPWNIINWRTTLIGSELRLSLVVLREEYVEEDDGFEEKRKTQYRVLRLVGGLYEQQIWRGDQGAFKPWGGVIQPLDGAGARLDEIPFSFIGAANNDSIPDEPPMGDMSELNIAHFRNSADYEESAFIVGQPTPVVSGLTEHWIKEVLNGELNFGSRGGIALPADASASLIQMQPNSTAHEGMLHKEQQMVALGAKLVEAKSVQRTATEATGDRANEASTLTSATNNVSAVFKYALEWCAIFSGIMTIREDAETDTIQFKLNTEFNLNTLTSDELRMIIESWVKEALTFSEMREFMRKAGYARLDDEKAKAEIEAMMPDRDDSLTPDDIDADE